jgi:transposase-like protein
MPAQNDGLVVTCRWRADSISMKSLIVEVSAETTLAFIMRSGNGWWVGVAELVAAYTAGGRVKQLAAQFGIHRDTVHNILKRQGALRPPGIEPGELPEVVRLYGEGWSMARLAAEFDVSPSTVNRALRKAGAPIRRPGPLRGSEAPGRQVRSVTRHRD